MKKITLLIVPVILIAFSACQSKETPKTESAATDQPAIVRNISAQDAKALLAEAPADGEKTPLLIDVREPDEFASGHIPDSINVPLGNVLDGLNNLELEKDAPVMLYCRSGRRSAEAAQTLLDAGYTNVYDLGGIIDWPYDTVK